MNISLCKMTNELARQYFREFQYDPDIFMDMRQFRAYIYSDAAADAAYARQIKLGRVYLAVMRDGEPIGEVVLKNQDRQMRSCTLGVHLQNDSVKNQGYGTQAEILALMYAFDILEMDTVYADAILKNTRSQHVLQKVGFIETHCDETFRYYRCDKAFWHRPQISDIRA